MKTLTFIGSDKNAGKTTVMNFVHRQLQKSRKGGVPLCLASVGINGEDVDTWTHRSKPRISLNQGESFITAGKHLRSLSGAYEILHQFFGGPSRQTYVFARCLVDLEIVLEGPNDREALLEMKRLVGLLLPKETQLLIDGSIDRQFLAHPWISDEIHVAVLYTSRQDQRTNADALLRSLTLPLCQPDKRQVLQRIITPETKSILLGETDKGLYHGVAIPFLDEALKSVCQRLRDQPCYLYLNGALTPSLLGFLAAFAGWTVVLDNFTFCRQLMTASLLPVRFRPQVTLYHPVPVVTVYLNQEAEEHPLHLPESLPVYNLFRVGADEIGI